MSTFVLQWVTSSMSHLAPLVASHFKCTTLFSHYFHGK